MDIITRLGSFLLTDFQKAQSWLKVYASTGLDRPFFDSLGTFRSSLGDDFMTALSGAVRSDRRNTAALNGEPHGANVLALMNEVYKSRNAAKPKGEPEPYNSPANLASKLVFAPE